jgi:hypothetical protein
VEGETVLSGSIVTVSEELLKISLNISQFSVLARKVCKFQYLFSETACRGLTAPNYLFLYYMF